MKVDYFSIDICGHGMVPCEVDCWILFRFFSDVTMCYVLMKNVDTDSGFFGGENASCVWQLNL
jgi:hypothetical protein